MAKQVLIIDDDPLVRDILRSMLESLGCAVSEAENGAQGIKSLETHDPDLVITDMLMPGQFAIETVAEIRTLRPGTRIIAITGGGSLGTKSFLDLALEQGADGALQKPVRYQDLEKIVGTLG